MSRLSNNTAVTDGLRMNIILVTMLIVVLVILAVVFVKNTHNRQQLVTAQAPVVITLVVGEAPKPQTVLVTRPDPSIVVVETQD